MGAVFFLILSRPRLLGRLLPGAVDPACLDFSQDQIQRIVHDVFAHWLSLDRFLGGYWLRGRHYGLMRGSFAIFDCRRNPVFAFLVITAFANETGNVILASVEVYLQQQWTVCLGQRFLFRRLIGSSLRFSPLHAENYFKYVIASQASKNREGFCRPHSHDALALACSSTVSHVPSQLLPNTARISQSM